MSSSILPEIEGEGKKGQTPESFLDWQNRIAKDIYRICKKDKNASEISMHLHNLGLDNTTDISLKVDDVKKIDNNFLYNIPNIIAYLYTYLGGKARTLIFSLARYYTNFTGKSPYDLNWDIYENTYPRGLKKKVDERNISEHFCLYLLGSAYHKKFLSKDKNHTFRYGPGKMLEKSRMFRGKIERLMTVGENLTEIEGLRVGIRETFIHIPEDVRSISEQEWLDYMARNAQEILDKEENGNISEINDSKGDTKEKTRAKRVLERQKKSGIIASSEKLPLAQAIHSEDIKEERERLIALGDFKTLPEKEQAWIHNIFAEVMRYKIYYPGNNIKTYALPKNFVKDTEFTCFSGSWLMASLLISAGFREKDIFIIDGQIAQDWTYYKHTFLLVRLSNGVFVRVDYGFNLVEAAHSEKQEVIADTLVPGIKTGLNHSRYHITHDESILPGLDNKGSMYRLTDGISLFYLVSLAGKQIEEGDYSSAERNLQLAIAIDPLHYTTYETYGLLYDTIGSPELALKAYEKAFLCNSCSLISRYRLGEKAYQDFISLPPGEKREAAGRIARRHFAYYDRYGSQAWGYPSTYLDNVHEYMIILEEENTDLSLEQQVTQLRERIKNHGASIDDIKKILNETPSPVLGGYIEYICKTYDTDHRWQNLWALVVAAMAKKDEPEVWKHVKGDFVLKLKFDNE